jgi:NTE family protein
MGLDQSLSPTIGPSIAGEDSLQDGVALCLSGGGYRAMLFHVGTLWRLNELAWLRKLNRVSSVSGGSITAGVFALAWKDLGFDATGVALNFNAKVVEPLRRLANIGIDVASVITGILLPWTHVSDRVESAYRKHLFGNRTLQDLPSDDEGPRFVFNATSVQTGALMRFSRPYLADYHLGMVKSPRVALAKVVAASSAFPPVLSPVTLSLEGLTFESGTGEPSYAAFRKEAVLTDGGVYDNMGLETAWKRYKTVLVSDGGAKMPPELSPQRNWISHIVRVLDIIDNQVRSLRKRITIDAFQAKLRDGTYFGIGTDISRYPIQDAWPVPHEVSLQLAAVPTRLAAIDDTLQKKLINWGYAVCDAALRSHVIRQATRPKNLPYPDVPLTLP